MFKMNEYVNINGYYVYRLYRRSAHPRGSKYLSLCYRWTAMVPLNPDEDIYFFRVPITESGAYLGMTLAS